LHQLDTFYNALNPNDQDALDSAAGGNFLDKIPRECLSIIESKSKVRYSNSRVTDVRANANAPFLLSSSSHSNSFDLQQIAASLEDKLDIRMNRFEKSLNDMKNSLLLLLHLSKQSLKYVLPADQTIVIISVHSLEEEMIFQYFTITSNNFIPQQSEISFKTVKLFLTRCVHRDLINLLIKTIKIVSKAIISIKIKTVNQIKELSIRIVHRITLIFKHHHNKTRLRKANLKPTPQQTMLI
nr:hypothetical protein [Tanacetum cinerariifolium]